MFDFLRPVPDPNLRIMIPEKTSVGSQISSGQEESAYEMEDDEPIMGRGAASTSAGAFPPAAGMMPSLAARARRHYKAYTVMQRSGFQHTEYVQIITHLCKAEIFISLLFLVHGLSCPGFPDESSYQGTCHINVLAALVGIFTGGMGLGAVHKFRWKTMLVMWLIMCIISSVANLLAVITTGVWLDHLSKLKFRTGLANGLSGLMLLGSVLVGVCFILTSVLICHYWASNSAKYQAVGRVAKRMRSLRRRSSRASSGGGALTASDRAASRNSSSAYPSEMSDMIAHHHSPPSGVSPTGAAYTGGRHPPFYHYGGHHHAVVATAAAAASSGHYAERLAELGEVEETQRRMAEEGKRGYNIV